MKQKHSAYDSPVFALCLCTRHVHPISDIAALADLFLNLCSLAHSVTQIVQLRSANLTLADHLYAVNNRRVQRENTLNTAAMCNTANSKGFADAAVLLCDYSTLEYLDTALVAFLDSYVNLYGITDTESRYFLLHACVADHFQCIHFNILLKFANIHKRAFPAFQLSAGFAAVSF